MSYSETDIEFMKRALLLAEKGRGEVAPNPMVGCVIVYEGRVIGEGYHQKYGGPHAEPNAVNAVENKELLAHSTVYVTLEPCAHHGKTPPCAELLASVNPQKVVIGSVDSNPLVGGKGIKRLRDAGIEVITGVLDDENRSLNRRFFTFIEKKRPYIILKWAQTADGFVARANYDSKWISGEKSRKRVHEWRAQEAGIMVATNTALYDNPSLNVRMAEGNDPVRILLDRHLKVPVNFNFYDQSQDTLIYNGSEESTNENLHKIKIDFEGDVLTQVLEDLHKRKVESLIVEGGSRLLNSFIDRGLWDEARVFTAPTTFLEGISAPKLPVDSIYEESIDVDVLRYYRNNESTPFR